MKNTIIIPLPDYAAPFELPSITPRTDAEVLKNQGKVMSVSSDFSRELEQELAQVRKMVARFLIAHRGISKNWLDRFVECGAVEINYSLPYPEIKPKT